MGSGGRCAFREMYDATSYVRPGDVWGYELCDGTSWAGYKLFVSKLEAQPQPPSICVSAENNWYSHLYKCEEKKSPHLTTLANHGFHTASFSGL